MSRRTRVLAVALPLVLAVLASPAASDAQSFNTAAITGRVTAAATGSPFVGTEVRVYSAAGLWFESATTDADGRYTTAQLPTGTSYYLAVISVTGYYRQFYRGIDCVANCPDVTQATAVPVAGDAATVSNIDFALVQWAAISGRVTTGDGGVPLPGVLITLYSSAGAAEAGAMTDADGNYTTVARLLPGNYYAIATPPAPYLAQVYSGIDCGQTCPAAMTGTAIPMAGTAGSPGINFVLSRGGSVSGRVTAAAGGAPIAAVPVWVVDSFGNYLSSGAPTGSDGSYTTTVALPTGTYFVVAQPATTYLTQVYRGVNCYGVACKPTTYGTAVAVTKGATTQGIDFELVLAGSISGTVRAAAGGAPVPGAAVVVYSASGAIVDEMSTSASGNYSTSRPLTAGTYYVTASLSSTYLKQLFGGTNCAVECPEPSTGTPVTVTASAQTTGIDFSLVRGGSIAGSVTSLASGTPVAGVRVAVWAANGWPVTSAWSGDDGAYVTTLALPTGTYYLDASGTVDYLRQIYRGMSCGLACPPITAGTPVTVTQGAATTGVDFPLAASGVVTGTVTDAVSGLPLPYVTVSISSPNGSSALANTNVSGVFTTTTPLSAGTYYAVAYGPEGYDSQVYRGIDCAPSCPAVTTGTAFTVNLGATTAGIDFALKGSAVITGRVTARATGLPLQGATINITNANGVGVGASLTTGADGQYRSYIYLAPGSYYVTATAPTGSGLLNQIYQGVDCSGPCPSATAAGTPITVARNQTRSGIDFALGGGAVIAGTVTRSESGEPINGIGVAVYTANGSVVATGSTNATGLYQTTALPPGTYYLAVGAIPGYLARWYGGGDCGLECVPPVSGTAISVTAGTTAGVDIALFKSGVIAGTVTSAATGEPLAGVSVWIYSSAGSLLGQVSTNAGGQYTSNLALTSGSYYAVALGADLHLAQLYGGTTCGRGCPPATTGAAIAVTRGQTTAGIDFHLLRGGAISGRVTAATGGQPLAGVELRIFTATDWITWTATDANGMYTTPTSLPRDTYYVRATGPNGYRSQIFQLVNCPATCPSITTGTPIAVREAETTPNIDFALVAVGSISGTVRAGDGAPVSGASVTVSLTTHGPSVASATTGADGGYTTPATLGPGAYYVKVSATGFFSQIYNGVDCIPTCPGPVAGDAVTLAEGQALSGIDFSLQRGAAIAGTITRAADSAPLSGIAVWLYDASGTYVASARSGADGSYQTQAPLPGGTYYLLALRETSPTPYFRQLYRGVNCGTTACPDVISGTPVAVVQGETKTGIDFAMATGGSISGTVTAARTGSPVVNASVSVYSATGERLWTGNSASNGTYTSVAPLSTGTYYVAVTNSTNYRGQIFFGLDCGPSCPSATTGSPVSVTLQVTTPGIDFVLAAAPPAFLDDPLTVGATPVRAAHITQLRSAIATLRSRYGLSVAAWTDPTITPGVTAVKAIHLQELRDALAAVYSAAGQTAPAWSPETVVSGQTVITAAHIEALRAAILAIW